MKVLIDDSSIFNFKEKSILSVFCYFGYLVKFVDGGVGGKVMFVLVW